MKKSISIAVLLLFVSSGLAATKFQEKQFSDGDKNGDNSLSKEEYIDVRLAVFKEFAEKKGNEFDAKKTEKQLGNAFVKLDINSDGKLSEEEFFAFFVKKK